MAQQWTMGNTPVDRRTALELAGVGLNVHPRTRFIERETNTNRVDQKNQYQQKQEQRHPPFTTHRHQVGGALQDSRLTTIIRSVACVIWLGSILLLTGILAVSITSVLPPGPVSVVGIFTVGLGVMAAAPIIAGWTFVVGLDAIESALETPDKDSIPRPEYDAETATALQVIALHDAGESEAAIEAATGVSQDTIGTILEQRDEFLARSTTTRHQVGQGSREVT